VWFQQTCVLPAIHFNIPSNFSWDSLSYTYAAGHYPEISIIPSHQLGCHCGYVQYRPTNLRSSSGLALAAGGDTHWCMQRCHYQLALCSSHPTWWEVSGWSAESLSRLGWCTQPANISQTPTWKDWQNPYSLSNDLHLSTSLKQWQGSNMNRHRKRDSWDTEKGHGLEGWKCSTANPWLYSSKVLRGCW